MFAGGDFHIDDPGMACVTPDIVIGVDRGIEHCLSVGIVPDVLIGDFDSVDGSVLHDSRLSHSETIRHPARKSSSDLELALRWLVNTDIERVVLLGISGGRSDHHLFNWMLPMQQAWPFSIELIDKSGYAYKVNAKYPLNISARPGQTISLIPMPDASGVTTSGLEYALQDATLTTGSTLGLSNVAVSETVSVSVSAGQLLAFHVKIEAI